jgi:hypothetical protein
MVPVNIKPENYLVFGAYDARTTPIQASFRLTFFHPDYTVGSGVAPDHAIAHLAHIGQRRCDLLVGCTTGRDLRNKPMPIQSDRSPCPEGLIQLV